MKASSWLWNINKTEAEVKRILANPEEKAFIHYAALLLSRHSGLPKEVFKDYLRKEDFCRYWQAIKRRMRKDQWNDERIPFWDGIYKFLLREFKKKGVTFPKETKELARNPVWEKTAAIIRTWRLARKMTQAELARKLGVKQQFISKIESGTQNLSLATLAKIENALGMRAKEYAIESPSTASFWVRDASISKPGTTWL
ncbi:MAG TPA: helix-turn-helix transcriptional regulator [Candidatus Omnitrophota bacterium]|nr:helix-turn-helix transcriptional regulator [Candidatus Omnitrophota bacterium]